MLLKSQISQIGIIEDMNVNEHWRHERLGKFTSSQVWKLCGKEGFGKTGSAYIRTRVFEAISGVTSEREFINEYSVNGLVEESWAIKKYCATRGVEGVVVQKLIYGENPLFSCTPDAILPIKETIDNTAIIQLETWEVKCFSPERHMACIESENELDVRKNDPNTWWQALDQSVNCGAKEFKIIYYNQDLPLNKGGLHVINCNQHTMVKDPKTGKPTFPIVEDIKFLKQRKQMAVEEFNRLYNKYCKL